VLGKLQTIYPNIMRLDYDNHRTKAIGIDVSAQVETEKRPLELFADFYEKQNGMAMTDEQHVYLSEIIETVWEGQK
jgi:exonuclease SbcD